MRALVLGVLVGVCSCSLLVDTDVLVCGPGMKYCEEKCVSVDEPFYGCTETLCDPCPGDHIIHRCEDNECTFKACEQGWGCTGCGTNLLTSTNHCGACDAACPRDGSGEMGWTCSAGVCVSPTGVRDASGAGGAGGEGGGGP